jgi:hypothetical protein
MKKENHMILRLLCITGLLAGLGLPAAAEAKTLRAARADLRQPPAAASPSDAAPLPGPASPAPTVAGAICCPERCITYKAHRPCRKTCCDCAAPVQTVLLVKDPCVCGCLVNVPVCLPACCTGAPEVCCHRGLLGRAVVEYEWCCGYRVKIVFDRCGDLIVHSYGA